MNDIFKNFSIKKDLNPSYLLKEKMFLSSSQKNTINYFQNAKKMKLERRVKVIHIIIYLLIRKLKEMVQIKKEKRKIIKIMKLR